MVINIASASVNRINIDPNIGITIDTVSELNPTPVESAANRKYSVWGYICMQCQKCIFNAQIRIIPSD